MTDSEPNSCRNSTTNYLAAVWYGSTLVALAAIFGSYGLGVLPPYVAHIGGGFLVAMVLNIVAAAMQSFTKSRQRRVELESDVADN